MKTLELLKSQLTSFQLHIMCGAIEKAHEFSSGKEAAERIAQILLWIVHERRLNTDLRFSMRFTSIYHSNILRFRLSWFILVLLLQIFIRILSSLNASCGWHNFLFYNFTCAALRCAELCWFLFYFLFFSFAQFWLLCNIWMGKMWTNCHTPHVGCIILTLQVPANNSGAIICWIALSVQTTLNNVRE